MSDTLEGRYFLSYGDDGQWNWTGQINKNLGGERYLVDINSAVTGMFNGSEIVSLATMERQGWKFYFSIEDVGHQASIEERKLEREIKEGQR